MQLSYQFDHSCEHVFSYLTDPKKFTSVHPIITKLEKIDKDTYKVYESMELGPFPYNFTYKAQFFPNFENYQLTIKAVVSGIVHITMDFRLQDFDGKCHLVEDVTFKSVLPVARMMEKVFREQHQTLFENIERS